MSPGHLDRGHRFKLNHCKCRATCKRKRPNVNDGGRKLQLFESQAACKRRRGNVAESRWKGGGFLLSKGQFGAFIKRLRADTLQIGREQNRFQGAASLKRSIRNLRQEGTLAQVHTGQLLAKSKGLNSHRAHPGRQQYVIRQGMALGKGVGTNLFQATVVGNFDPFQVGAKIKGARSDPQHTRGQPDLLQRIKLSIPPIRIIVKGIILNVRNSLLDKNMCDTTGNVRVLHALSIDEPFLAVLVTLERGRAIGVFFLILLAIVGRRHG